MSVDEKYVETEIKCHTKSMISNDNEHFFCRYCSFGAGNDNLKRVHLASQRHLGNVEKYERLGGPGLKRMYESETYKHEYAKFHLKQRGLDSLVGNLKFAEENVGKWIEEYTNNQYKFIKNLKKDIEDLKELEAKELKGENVFNKEFWQEFKELRSKVERYY